MLNNTADFSNLEVFIATQGSRATIWQTLTCILAAVNNAKVTIAYNGNDFPGFVTQLKSLGLYAFAEIHRNSVFVIAYDSQYSLAQMQHDAFLTCLTKNIMLVDDDIILPANTLKAISLGCATDQRFNTLVYGMIDVENLRGYKLKRDLKGVYDIPDLKNFEPYEYNHYSISTVQFIELPHNSHICYDLKEGESLPDNHSMGNRVVNARVASSNAKLMARLKAWPKGQRGVDVYTSGVLGSVYFLAGANAYHVDTEVNDIAGSWSTRIDLDALIKEDR